MTSTDAPHVVTEGDLRAFSTKYGGTVEAALAKYAEYMRGEALAAFTAYNEIKDDPIARAAQDAPSATPDTINAAPTTEGLRLIGELALEHADNADAALKAYQELADFD